MGAFFDDIPSDSLKNWIREQKMFFVATAPLSINHNVNVSPKGHDTFHIVDSKSCYYVELSGSGNETVSHLYENGRITIMFCGFTGPPRIVRLFGKGKVYERDTPQFDKLLPPGDPGRLPGVRSIIWIDIHKVGTSCGYSVPFMNYVEDRPTLLEFFEKREESDAQGRDADGLNAYWRKKNAESLDGLPGLKLALPSATGKSFQDVSSLKKGDEKDEFRRGVVVGLMGAILVYVLFTTFWEPFRRDLKAVLL